MKRHNGDVCGTKTSSFPEFKLSVEARWAMVDEGRREGLAGRCFVCRGCLRRLPQVVDSASLKPRGSRFTTWHVYCRHRKS